MKIILLLILLPVLFSCGHDQATDQQKQTAAGFGDSIPISNGLKGSVFLLSNTTSVLPDFDTMHALPDPIYAREINMPLQDWSQGFPGMRDRQEYFAIEYVGDFKPVTPGTYHFRLLSDDGSKLYIDDSLVIDNDGRHAEREQTATLTLSEASHRVRLDYFQGPRYQLSLQLFWNLNNQKEQIFPGTGFILHTPTCKWCWLWWVLAAALFLAALYWYYRKKSRRRASA